MNLRDMRKRAGYTQARLSEVAGVRAATISDLETGRITEPHYTTVVRLARALDVAPSAVAAAIIGRKAA
jgi:transcriptional regulator with XRE-family HTH domain